jgi:hypothetical protein
MTYADPPAFFIFTPHSAFTPAAEWGLRVRTALFIVPFVFVSGSSFRLFRQAKGWRHFNIAGCVLGRRLRHFRPTWRPRAPREPGTLASTDQSPGREPGGPRIHGKDRAIDPMSGKKYARLKRARSGSSLASGRAPALHALRVSHDPCLCVLSLRFAMRSECGRFPSGALRAPFIQRWLIMAIFRLRVKKFPQNVFSQKVGKAVRAARSATKSRRP